MESVSANRMQPRVGFFKVNWSAFKINTKSCLRSSIINRRKAWAEKLQTIPFVALFLTSVQLSLCPAWIELLKAAAVPLQMSGECLAHGESFHEWISTFRMPNIWKPFIFKFTCQDISSGLCVYGWPTMALPTSIKQCKNTALHSAVGRQLLASPTWNPEASFAVWSGHQAFWFNWDYKLHSSLEFKPYLHEGEMPKVCSGVLQRPSGKWDSIAPVLWEPMLGDVSQCGKIETVHELGQRILFFISSTVFSSSARGMST